MLVPFGDGIELIEELGAIDPVHQPGRLAVALERAKAYCVFLYGFQRRKLEDSGTLCGSLHPPVVIPKSYDNELMHPLKLALGGANTGDHKGADNRGATIGVHRVDAPPSHNLSALHSLSS